MCWCTKFFFFVLSSVAVYICSILNGTVAFFDTSDVTKLVKIECNFDFQNPTNANANRGIYFIDGNVMHWFRSIK